jgi:hypothetical protein
MVLVFFMIYSETLGYEGNVYSINMLDQTSDWREDLRCDIPFNVNLVLVPASYHLIWMIGLVCKLGISLASVNWLLANYKRNEVVNQF